MYEFQNIREENFVCVISESIITITQLCVGVSFDVARSINLLSTCE